MIWLGRGLVGAWSGWGVVWLGRGLVGAWSGRGVIARAIRGGMAQESVPQKDCLQGMFSP